MFTLGPAISHQSAGVFHVKYIGLATIRVTVAVVSHVFPA